MTKFSIARSCTPIERVSSAKYKEELDSRLEPADLRAGQAYRLRLITAPLGKCIVADDFLVEVTDIDKRRGSLVTRPHYKVAFCPLNEDNRIVDPEWIEERSISVDGLVLVCRPFRLVGTFDDGYIRTQADDIDREWDNFCQINKGMLTPIAA